MTPSSSGTEDASLHREHDGTPPTLGIDIDGTIDEGPAFFRTLAAIWPGRVIIITYRRDRAQTEADLVRLGIRYHDLILVSSFDAKAEVIERERVDVYFDDQPEMLRAIPAHVNVMLVRNEGNFCFTDRLWLFSDQTGRPV